MFSIYMRNTLLLFLTCLKHCVRCLKDFSCRTRFSLSFSLRKDVANIARLPKVLNTQKTLFTIHNGVKSGTANDLNKRRDLHNNYQTTSVRPRCSQSLYLHVSHFLMCVWRSKRQDSLLSVFWRTCVFGVYSKILTNLGDVNSFSYLETFYCEA